MAKVVVYTKTPCPYCDRAKTFLKNKGVPYEERHITDPDEMIALKKRTGWMTFPLIFVGEKLIGGFDDMNALDKAGEFDKLLKAP